MKKVWIVSASLAAIFISALSLYTFVISRTAPNHEMARVANDAVLPTAQKLLTVPSDESEPQVTEFANRDLRDAPYGVSVVAPGLPMASPLPPRDSPLALIYDDLKSRADLGDTQASCRMSYELARCRRMETAQKLAEEFTRSAEHSMNGSVAQDQNIDKASTLAESASRDKAVCGAGVPKDAPEAWRYLLRAAEQGHVPSMVRFAIQPPLREDHFVEDLEGWKAYAENAGRLLRTAAATGDPSALYYLHWAHAGYPTPGGTAVAETDPGLALAYAISVERSVDAASRAKLRNSEVRLRSLLTTEQIQIAEREGNRMASTVRVKSEPINLISNLVPDTSDECEMPGAHDKPKDDH